MSDDMLMRKLVLEVRDGFHGMTKALKAIEARLENMAPNERQRKEYLDEKEMDVLEEKGAGTEGTEN